MTYRVDEHEGKGWRGCQSTLIERRAQHTGESSKHTTKYDT